MFCRHEHDLGLLWWRRQGVSMSSLEFPGSSPALTLKLPLQLKQEMGSTVMDIIQNYTFNATSSREEAWDYVQAQVRMAVGDETAHLQSWV